MNTRSLTTQQLTDWLWTRQTPTIIVTANKRLVKRLRQLLSETANACRTLSTHQTPELMTWHHFVDYWFDLCQFNQAAIQLDDADAELQRQWLSPLQAWALASACAEDNLELGQWLEHAYNRLVGSAFVDDLAVKGHQPPAFLEESQSVYQQWSDQFQLELTRLNLAHPSEKLSYIGRVLPHLALPDIEILWLGFIDWQPDQLAFIQRLDSLDNCTHCSIAWVAEQPALPQCIALEDQQQEFWAALNWAQQLHHAHSEARIAIVVPHLAEMRTQLKQWYLTYCQVHQDQQPMHVSFTGGDPLAQMPMISVALQIFQLLNPIWSLQDVCACLRSPFIGIGLDRTDSDWRELIMNWPQTADYQVYASWFAQYAQAPQHTLVQLPTLAASMHSMTVPCMTLQQWCETWLEALTMCQWPGPGSLGSREYQCLLKWHEVLGQMSVMDVQQRDMSHHQAYQLLNAAYQQTLFAEEGDSDQVQVMGIYEAIAQVFDGTWVMGLTDQDWPTKPHFNPFLPDHLGNKSAQQQYQWAQQVLQGYQACTRQLIYSWPQRHKDRIQLPTAMLREVSALAASDALDVADLLSHQVTTELILVDSGQPLDPETNVRGGASLFKVQAECSFKAFAYYRLGLSSSEQTAIGWQAFERGQVIHQVLETVWQHHPNSAWLAGMAESDLRALLAPILKEKMLAFKTPRHQALEGMLVEGEYHKLLSLLVRWLEHEKKRTPFSVLQIEAETHITLGPLKLRLRLDRLDQLQEGSRVLIDYKTGAVNIYDWLSTPCLAPQLPLYVIADVAEEGVAAIAYAQVIDTPVIRGIGESISLYQEAPEKVREPLVSIQDWPRLQNQWREELTEMATSFAAGKAELTPLNQEATCASCELQAICKIQHKKAMTDDIE